MPCVIATTRGLRLSVFGCPCHLGAVSPDVKFLSQMVKQCSLTSAKSSAFPRSQSVTAALVSSYSMLTRQKKDSLRVSHRTLLVLLVTLLDVSRHNAPAGLVEQADAAIKAARLLLPPTL